MAGTEIKKQMEVEKILQVLDVGLNGESGRTQTDGVREQGQIKDAGRGQNGSD